MENYDVLILGGGLGGLISGTILSREGYKVCVAEKHHQLGGALQNFTRQGVIFDSGGHYIGGVEKGQNLYQIFKYLNLIDKINIKKLDTDGYDIISFMDNQKDYPHCMGFDNFSHALVNEFPSEKENIKKYIHTLQNIRDEFPLFQLKVDNKYSLLKGSVYKTNYNDFLLELTDNQRLRNVLSGNNLLYAGNKNHSPLFVPALIQYSYIESAYRVINGASQIAELLGKQIKNNGGDILLNTEISKLNINEKSIDSAQTPDGRKIHAEEYISNIHPTRTFEMISKEKVRKVYYNRIMNLKNSISVFSLYIVLKKNSFPYLNHNVYILQENDAWKPTEYEVKSWPGMCIFISQPSDENPSYAKGITVLAYMRYEEVKKWENTDIERRGDDYVHFKEQKANTLIDFVAQKFPDIRNSIHSYYTSTPLTYRDYTATREGAFYGVLRDSKNPMKNMVLPKTKIPNLYFVGQNTTLHGVMGVSIGSILSCSQFIGLNYLVDKIKKA